VAAGGEGTAAGGARTADRFPQCVHENSPEGKRRYSAFSQALEALTRLAQFFGDKVREFEADAKRAGKKAA